MKKLFTLVALAVCAMTASAQTFDNEAFSATWSMADGEESVAVVVPEEALVSSKWSLGSKLTFDKVATQFDIPMTCFTRVGNDKGNNDLKNAVTADSYIDYTIVFKDGLTFAPESASFDITKIGTGDPAIFVHFIADATTSLGDNVEILRNNSDNSDNATLHQEFDIASKNITPTSTATLRIYIGKLASGKQVGIADVVIKGKVSGTASNKATYSITVKANPAEGGKVSASAENVTEGNDVTLTATPNRGYNFVNWTDANGGVVSEEASFTIVPESDITYTANFQLADARTITVASADEAAGTVLKYVFNGTELATDDIVLDGDSVIIEARNNSGFLFKEWSDGNTQAVRSFIVKGDFAVNAIFETLPDKQTIAYFPLAANTNASSSGRVNCAPTFAYADMDTENGFALEAAAEVFGENMLTFLYPEYDAADPASKMDSTFYVNINPRIGEGEVFVIRSIEFNAVRQGTDAGDWRVSIIRDGDEENAEIVAEGFKVGRNNTKTLPHYYFNVTSNRVAEESAEVRLTVCAAGNKKKYNLNKLRIQGYVCDKEAVGITEVKSVSATASAIYNLAGQRVSAAHKGLYIRDGKKFVK